MPPMYKKSEKNRGSNEKDYMRIWLEQNEMKQQCSGLNISEAVKTVISRPSRFPNMVTERGNVGKKEYVKNWLEQNEFTKQRCGINWSEDRKKPGETLFSPPSKGNPTTSKLIKFTNLETPSNIGTDRGKDEKDKELTNQCRGINMREDQNTPGKIISPPSKINRTTSKLIKFTNYETPYKFKKSGTGKISTEKEEFTRTILKSKLKQNKITAKKNSGINMEGNKKNVQEKCLSLIKGNCTVVKADVETNEDNSNKAEGDKKSEESPRTNVSSSFNLRTTVQKLISDYENSFNSVDNIKVNSNRREKESVVISKKNKRSYTELVTDDEIRNMSREYAFPSSSRFPCEYAQSSTITTENEGVKHKIVKRTSGKSSNTFTEGNVQLERRDGEKISTNTRDENLIKFDMNFERVKVLKMESFRHEKYVKKTLEKMHKLKSSKSLKKKRAVKRSAVNLPRISFEDMEDTQMRRLTDQYGVRDLFSEFYDGSSEDNARLEICVQSLDVDLILYHYLISYEPVPYVYVEWDFAGIVQQTPPRPVVDALFYADVIYAGPFSKQMREFCTKSEMPISVYWARQSQPPLKVAHGTVNICEAFEEPTRAFIRDVYLTAVAMPEDIVPLDRIVVKLNCFYILRGVSNKKLLEDARPISVQIKKLILKKANELENNNSFVYVATTFLGHCKPELETYGRPITKEITFNYKYELNLTDIDAHFLQAMLCESNPVPLTFRVLEEPCTGSSLESAEVKELGTSEVNLVEEMLKKKRDFRGLLPVLNDKKEKIGSLTVHVRGIKVLEQVAREIKILKYFRF